MTGRNGLKNIKSLSPARLALKPIDLSLQSCKGKLRLNHHNNTSQEIKEYNNG